MKKSLGKAFSEQELAILPCQPRQLRGQGCAVRRHQDFRALLADLRSVNAHPDAVYFRARAPEIHVLFQIILALQHRARNHPVHVKLAAFHILKDALVSRRLPPDVVVFRQAVNRNCYTQPWDFHPLPGNGNHAAGYDHRKHAHLAKRRKNCAELAMPHHRFSTDQRNVQWLVPAHQAQNALHQRISAQVVQLTQCDSAAQVPVSIGVASGTAQRTLPRDLDGKHRNPAAQHPAPGGKHPSPRQTRVWRNRGHLPQDARTARRVANFSLHTRYSGRGWQVLQKAVEFLHAKSALPLSPAHRADARGQYNEFSRAVEDRLRQGGWFLSLPHPLSLAKLSDVSRATWRPTVHGTPGERDLSELSSSLSS